MSEGIFSNKEIDFSIAVCTYNPDSALLKRLLDALQAILTTTQSIVEILLVDNNSFPAITTLTIVQDFLSQTPYARCVVEPQQGLAAARCRAIRETSAPLVVFFDDDNEPSPDYLQVLNRYFTHYPNVGVWGPGQITVEYVDPVEAWLRQHAKSFQQRQIGFGYSCLSGTWELHFPNGTGFAVRRKILEIYVSAIEQGTLKATGRASKALTSAEDIQIVWEGIKLGFAAGMIPELRCNHLITKDKANLSYLKRLHFGTASSYAPAIRESFPDSIAQLGQPPSMLQVYKRLIKAFIKMLFYPKKWIDIQLEIADELGNFYGHAYALGLPYHHKILALAKRLSLT
ncbi:MAG TPA: glycosyltransferase [Phormidium sp.]